MSEPESPAATAPGPSGRVYFELFLISFAILFFELACIRWFGSTVVFLTFFTNLVLMACFLGMSVGCLAASRKRDLINATAPMTLLAMILAGGMLWGYNNSQRVVIDMGGQQSPQQVFFGTERGAGDPSKFVIPVEVVAGVFYVLIALIFLGPGQVLGRRFDAVPNRITAYMLNLLGSLAGIAAFSAVSYLRLPPMVWFGVGIGLCLIFTSRYRPLQVAVAGLILGLLAFMAFQVDSWAETTWSPYYKVQYTKSNNYIYVN